MSMIIVLDVTSKGYIHYPLQVCCTVEGFEYFKKEHPEDTYLVHNKESEEALREFKSLLTFLGWDITVYLNYQNFLVNKMEELELKMEEEFEDLLWKDYMVTEDLDFFDYVNFLTC